MLQRSARLQLLLVLLLSLVALSQYTALQVTPLGLSPLAATDCSAHERFAHEWRVDGQALRSITVSASCQTYITYAALDAAATSTFSSGSLTVATVRAIGDNRRLLQLAVDVSSFATALIVAPAQAQEVSGAGFVRLEIVVHQPASLKGLSSSGGGDMVVESHVLADDASGSLVVETSGSGGLFLPSQLPLRASKLEIRSHGSGGLQLLASDVKTDALVVSSSGSGDVKLDAATFSTQSALLQAIGYGSLAVSFGQLDGRQLEVQSSGSGDVSIRRNAVSSRANTPMCTYTLSGAGDVDAGDVTCTSAVVQNSGSGDVTVRASVRLVYSVNAWSDIFYVTPAPISVSSMTGRSGDSVHAISARPPSPPTWIQRYSVPTRQTAKLVLGSGQNLRGDFDADAVSTSNLTQDPNIQEESQGPELPYPETSQSPIEAPPGGILTQPHAENPPPQSDPSADVQHEEPGKTSSHWQRGVLVLLVIGVVLAAKRAHRKHQRVRRHGENAPLLSQDSPVYV